MPITFEEFPKIGRLSRSMVITEKIDGTNGQIIITEEGEFGVASRSRLITPEQDNYGFAKWAYENKDELMKLGPGRHFGEWWGSGCQRGYGLERGEKRFSLFNTPRWTRPEVVLPSCVSLVPVLYIGDFSMTKIDEVMAELKSGGSKASPGFMNPEGVVIFHAATRTLFKKTFEKDDASKGKDE
jgi:hypothetical protein